MLLKSFPSATVLCFSILLGLLGIQPAMGQADANKGQIVGTVLDPNGSVVPNAKVVFRNGATGFRRELTTGSEGQFRAVALDPGTYELSATAAGFAESKITDIALTVGSAISIEVNMSVQATSTVIEVGETMISDVQTSSSATVGNTAITNLPINGRRFQDFAQLTPTVQVTGGTRNQLSFAGQRGVNSNIMLDGGDYNQPFFGGIRGGERSNSIITVPQSAVQEFQVVTTGYSAEYGRSTGGVMNAITKSGTNELHGQGFFQARPREASLENPIPQNLPTGRQKVTPSETLYQYGGSVGGAIKKDRVFWLGAVESQNATTPRNVLFSTLNNFTPTPDTLEAYNYFKSQEGPFDQTNRATAALAKIDFNFSNGDRMTFKYNFSDSNEVNAVTTGGDIAPFSSNALSTEGIEKDRIHNGAFQYTKLLGTAAVNDFRFIYSAEERPRLSNSDTPSVNGSPVGSFGATSFLPTTQNDKRIQFADALSMTKGKHTIKVGGDYNYLTAAQQFGFNQFGAFNAGGGATATVLDVLGGGGAINRFGASTVSYQRQIGNMQASYNMHQIAFFAQDNWRLHPQFTLDFGLRYEAQLNPTPDASNTDLVNRVKGFAFPLGLTADPTIIPDARNQWMPRAGFAWTPIQGEGRTVVRGNFGVFYASTPMLLFADPINNFRTPPGNVSLLLNSTTAGTVYDAFKSAGLDLNTTPLNALPVIPIDVVQKAASFLLGGGTPDPFRGASVTMMATDFQNPRSYQGGLGMDTELFRNFIFGVQFNYIKTVHLERNRDYNVPFPIIVAGDQTQRPNFGIRNDAFRPSVSRPISTLGSVQARESSAKSMYRAATVNAQYRLRKVQFQAFYTLSENFSDDDNERSSGGNLFENPFNYKPEYSYSDLDFRHQFTSNAVYTLPWGFEIGAIYRYRTGFPLSPRVNVDVNQDTTNNDRPYQAAGIPFKRNSFRNRDFQTFDLRFLKSINLGERMRVQFSVEMFNLFNTENVIFSGNGNIYGRGFQPNGTYQIDPQFMLLRGTDGEYNAATTSQQGKPFQAQFGARFFF